jgi:hypothetical protein
MIILASDNKTLLAVITPHPYELIRESIQKAIKEGKKGNLAGVDS